MNETNTFFFFKHLRFETPTLYTYNLPRAKSYSDLTSLFLLTIHFFSCQVVCKKNSQQVFDNTSIIQVRTNIDGDSLLKLPVACLQLAASHPDPLSLTLRQLSNGRKWREGTMFQMQQLHFQSPDAQPSLYLYHNVQRNS